MNNLQKLQNFVENGVSHEKSALTDMVFKDIDYNLFEHPVSFFRSDLSRSRFYNCSFALNEFGRADFIDVYIKNCDFTNVDFGSCLIKNALLDKVTFKKNRYHGVAIQYSYFKTCTFRDEHFITNMSFCQFAECTFINCTFEKTSLDNNTFSNCEFIKVDMSECIAESLKFDNCALRDVYLCANLWTTYLYKNTDIYNFGFKYRGEIVDIWNGDAKKFIKELYHKGLFFEYLNTIIVSEFIPQQMILKEVCDITQKTISQLPQIRKSTFLKIFDMLLFYQNYDKISLENYIAIYNYYSLFTWDNIPFDELLEYQAALFKIKASIERFSFSISYIKSISPSSICISKFHINTNNSAKAVTYITRVFDIANQDLCDNAFTPPLYKILQQESGSVILTIASAALLALLVSQVAKKVMHNIISIQIDSSIKKQLVSQIQKSNTLTELKKSCELAKEQHYVKIENNEEIERLSTEIAKGEILEIILNFLF